MENFSVINYALLNFLLLQILLFQDFVLVFEYFGCKISHHQKPQTIAAEGRLILWPTSHSLSCFVLKYAVLMNLH